MVFYDGELLVLRQPEADILGNRREVECKVCTERAIGFGCPLRSELAALLTALEAAVQIRILLDGDCLEFLFGQTSREQLHLLRDAEAPARSLWLLRGREEAIGCPNRLDA